jgi:hypothetical protein
MYVGKLTLSGNLKLFAAVMASTMLVPSLVNAEKLYSKVTREEAASLSSPLKTFICLGERLKPDWCTEFRNSKLVARVRVVEESDETRKADGPLSMEQELENQPDLMDTPEVVIVEVKKVVVPEKSAREKEWDEFRDAGNFAKLTEKNVELLLEMAESNSAAEANEILGFAYINGSGVIGKSKVKAYRQYGIAYLKGMTRVKPNMDLLWKKFTKSEQFALIHEFKKLKAENKYTAESEDTLSASN